MIGNSDAVGVPGQVAQDMLRAAEGRFEVDHQSCGQGTQSSLLLRRVEALRQTE